MIEPSIGRVVWVCRGQSDQAEPALITYVWNSRLINVGGFDRSGEPFSLTSLELLQEAGEAPVITDRYEEWMPFQKKSAAGPYRGV